MARSSRNFSNKYLTQRDELKNAHYVQEEVIVINATNQTSQINSKNLLKLNSS